MSAERAYVELIILTEGTNEGVLHHLRERHFEELLLGTNVLVSSLLPQSDRSSLQDDRCVCLWHRALEEKHDASKDHANLE